jgi:hypothetical protein
MSAAPLPYEDLFDGCDLGLARKLEGWTTCPIGQVCVQLDATWDGEADDCEVTAAKLLSWRREQVRAFWEEFDDEVIKELGAFREDDDPVVDDVVANAIRMALEAARSPGCS